MKYLIYALVDPRDGRWRYIGKSERGMARPRQHRLPSQMRLKNHKNNWIKALIALDRDFQVEVLEVLPSADGLYEAEQEWIAAARAAGVPLDQPHGRRVGNVRA